MKTVTKIFLGIAAICAAVYVFRKFKGKGNISTTVTKTKLEITAAAKDVVHGKYGFGKKRKEALEDAGFDYKTVQEAANKIVREKDEKYYSQPEIAILNGDYGYYLEEIK